MRLTHGFMEYQCHECGMRFRMWLEKGLEDREEFEKTGKHKPVPFMIRCPNCRGLANDISGLVKMPNYMPLTGKMDRFENIEEKDCGVAVYGGDTEMDRQIYDRLSRELAKQQEKEEKEIRVNPLLKYSTGDLKAELRRRKKGR